MASIEHIIQTTCHIVDKARSGKMEIYDEYNARWVILTLPEGSQDMMHCHASTSWIARTRPADEDYESNQALNLLHWTHKPTAFCTEYLTAIAAWNSGCRSDVSLFITNNRATHASDASMAVAAFQNTTMNLEARTQITRKGSPTTGGGFWEATEDASQSFPFSFTECTMQFYGPYEWIGPHRSNDDELFPIMDGGACVFHIPKGGTNWVASEFNAPDMLRITAGTPHCFIAAATGLTMITLTPKNVTRVVEFLPDIVPPWDDAQNFVRSNTKDI